PYKTSVNSIANRYIGSTTGRVSWTFDNSEHHAAYLLVVVGVGTNEKPNVQLEEGNGSSDYEEPKFKFDGVVELDYVTNMGEGVVGYKNTNFITHGKNLFRSEEHTSELQSRFDLVCRLLLEKKNRINKHENDIGYRRI